MEGRRTQANQQRPQPASATQVVGKNGMEEGDGVNFPAQKGNGGGGRTAGTGHKE